MTDIIIQNAPMEYRPYLSKADDKYNANSKIDSQAEADSAVKDYCSKKHESNCSYFFDYLERSGYVFTSFKNQLITGKITKRQALRRGIKLNPREIIFPKGYLPREGATVTIKGKQYANAVWGSKKSLISEDMTPPTEVTFAFDASGSMKKSFPGSSVSKYQELKTYFRSLLNSLPDDLGLNLNLFGPGDTEKVPILSMEVKKGNKTKVFDSINKAALSGATYLWANLKYSVENTQDGGLVLVYSDGISDIYPTGHGPEEENKNELMKNIAAYAEKHNIKIFVACGSKEVKTHLSKFSQLTDNVRLFYAGDSSALKIFFGKVASAAMLRPQNAEYTIEINNLDGKPIERFDLTQSSAAPGKVESLKVIKAKAGTVKLSPNGQIQIGDLSYVDESGRSGKLNLAAFTPAGQAEYILDAVPVSVPALTDIPQQRVISLVLDRSGSMIGEKIEKLKQAAIKFVENFTLAKFDENEFRGKYSAYKLLLQIDNDTGGVITKSLKNAKKTLFEISQEEQIKLLNLLLEVPPLYSFWQNKNINISSSPYLSELLDETEFIRKKKYEELTASEQLSILFLNRLLFQSVYPQLCPRRNLSALPHLIGINFYEDGNAGQVGFYQNENIELSPTHDFKKLKNTINQSNPAGQYAGNPAWQNIMLSLTATPMYGTLVIFSDGDLGQGIPKEFKMKVLDLAINKNVKIYFIGLSGHEINFRNVIEASEPIYYGGMDEFGPQTYNDLGFLKYITKRTTGLDSAFVAISNINDLHNVFKAIKNQIVQSSLLVRLPAPSSIKIPVRRGSDPLILEIQLSEKLAAGAAKAAAARPPVNTFRDSLVPGVTLKVEKFYKDGTVASGSLASPVDIHETNLPIGTRVFFGRNGRVTHLILQKDMAIGRYSFKLKAGMKITLDHAGKIESGYLAEEMRGMGETPSGKLFAINLKADSLIKFSDFGKNKISGGVLAADTTIDGITFKAGTWQEMHDSNDGYDRIKIGTLAKPADIDGKTYSEGTTIWLSPSGKVIKAETND